MEYRVTFHIYENRNYSIIEDIIEYKVKVDDESKTLVKCSDEMSDEQVATEIAFKKMIEFRAFDVGDCVEVESVELV